MSHSTVLRRLAELESAMGVRVFERTPEGYQLTPAGQDVFDTAKELEEIVGSLERRVEGRDTKLSGRVRITLPDLLLRPLLPVFADVGRAYPDIEMTLAGGTSYLDLAHREADLALRIADAPPPELVGRKLAKVAVGVYGSKAYLARRSTKDLASLDWIAMNAESQIVFARWMNANVPRARIAMRVTETTALPDAVHAGLGVTVLPCVTGDMEPTWKRVALIPEIAPPMWILSHRDLRTTARVRVLRDAFAEAIAGRRSLLEGKRTSRS